MNHGICDRLAWVCGAVGVFAAGALGLQPANDLCSHAQAITVPGLNAAVTFTGTTLQATSDLPQSCALGDQIDVWYRFTAPLAGTYSFDTIGSTLYDTTLSVYSTCGGTQLACNDNIDPANFIYWSAVTLPLTAGQQVLVRVSAAQGDSDDFNLTVFGTGAVTNDACANAFTITVNQTVTGSTLNATTDFVLPATACGSDAGSGGGKDVFYAFTPPSTGQYLMKTCGSNFDTVLAVLTNCTGASTSVVACSDDSTLCTASMNSEIPSVQLTGGVRYLIRVAGYDYGPPVDIGAYTLTVSSAAPGICCRGATCAIIPAASCTPIANSLGGAKYINGATGCNAAGQYRTPCCYAEYNKDGILSVQDIFDYLNDWFAGRLSAVVGGDGFTGTLDISQVFVFLNAWFGGC
jgi:hypothetical protein